MPRLLAMSAILGLLVAVVAVTPVSARTRIDVTMTVATLLEQEPSEFTATLPGCTEGLTYSGGNAAFPGAGKLVGVPIEGENGITDNYVGTITL